MQNSSGQAGEALKTACNLVEEENYGRAFAHFLLALTLDPSLKDKENTEDMFVDCLNSWATQLVSMERGQDAVWCYEQACNVLAQSASVHHATGQFLFSCGYHTEGTSFLQRAVCKKPQHPDWHWDLQNASSSLVERWHFRMLNDRKRNQCYFEALKKSVRSGHQKILDIGSGTGLLSMLAVKAGAQKVTAVEMDETMCSLSRDIIEDNRMKKHVNVIKIKSTEMQALPAEDRYTLAVTETADAGLLGEGIIPTLEHAWKHLLRRNDESEQVKGDSTDTVFSRVIPSGATVYIQLIQSDFIKRQHRVHSKEVLGLLNKADIISKSVNMTHNSSSATSEETEPYSSENLSSIPGVWLPLTTPHQAYSFDFNNPEILTTDHMTETMIELPITSPGRVDAVISWFDLHLDHEVTISSAPEAGTCWEQAVYPIHPSHIDQGHDGNNTNFSVNLDDSVKISCKCQPTWMSFQLKEIKRNSQAASDMKCLDVSAKGTFQDGSQVLRLKSKDIASLNDDKYCRWLENSVRSSLTEKLKSRTGEVSQEISAGFQEDEVSVSRTSKDAVNETISCISCDRQEDGRVCEEVITRLKERDCKTLDEIDSSMEVSEEVSVMKKDGDKTQSNFERDLSLELGLLKHECGNHDENVGDEKETSEEAREKRLTILDLSGINLSYFTCSFQDLGKREVIGLIPSVNGETLFEKIADRNERVKEKFRKYTLDSLETASENHLKLIISDLVESGGVLRKNALEDVYFSALKSSSQREVKVIPQVLTIQAVCIESDELSKNAKISGCESTCGIDVHLLNTFKTSTQLYVCLPKLPHKQLTDKFKIFTLDLTKLVKNENPMDIFTQSMELMLEAKDSGKLSAVLYWFEMKCGESILSTMDEETHWMQAAFILDEGVLVQYGEKIHVNAYFRSNAMSFIIKKSKSN